MRARCQSDVLSSRSSADEDCRTALLFIPYRSRVTGAPNENIVQNHLNIALLNVF